MLIDHSDWIMGIVVPLSALVAARLIAKGRPKRRSGSLNQTRIAKGR
jgi:hypothetical protein